MLANLVTELKAKWTLTVGVFSITYTDVSNDESDSVNPEGELHTVLSMLDDVLLPEFDFCNKEKVSESVNIQSLIGLGPVAMDVLANIQINFCYICLKYR